MIKLDLNKWVEQKKDFYQNSVVFEEEDLVYIENLIQKGNDIQKEIKNLKVESFKDIMSYIKRVNYLQSIQNDITIDLWYYNNWFKREYEEKENKRRKREFNRTVARFGA